MDLQEDSRVSRDEEIKDRRDRSGAKEVVILSAVILERCLKETSRKRLDTYTYSE